jgi:predicted permease
MASDPRPPLLARALLRLRSLGDRRDEVVADLDELFRSRVAQVGRLRASLRYYADVLSVWRRNPRARVAMAAVAPGQGSAARWLSDARVDLVYAGRLFRRQPTFAAVAIVSLAFGVGANTLVFSIVNALVLKPLPVDRPAELAFIDQGGSSTYSYPAYRDLRDRNDSLSGLLAFRFAPMSLDRDGRAMRVWGYLVSGNYFDVLGVKPAAGRFFHQSEDQPPSPSPLAVLSYDCWMGRFAGDPSIVGTTVHINGGAYQVLGVTPRGFIGTELFYRPEVWVPMTMEPQIEARQSWLNERRTQNAMLVGRLKPGVTVAGAEANLRSIAAALGREYPQSDAGMHPKLSQPGLVGDALGGPVRAFTLGVLLLAALTLLMACVNLAVVLTASGADRRRELAIRLSIGAGAGRLRRQVLTETLLLAAAGGLVGLALAFGAAGALSAWRLPVEVPVQFDVTPDWRVFVFALGVSLVAGILFGLAPARDAARTDPNAALKGLDATPRARRRWALRDVLVAVQVMLCVVLLASSLLALRGLQAALAKPIGMRPSGLTVAGFDVGLAGYDEARGQDFERRAIEAVRQLPGVDAAAYSDTLPLNIDQSNTTVIPDDQPALALTAMQSAARFRVSPDFFRTLGVAVREGREIASSDVAGGQHVAVINETFARKILRSDHPIGRRFRYGWSGAWFEVVGVVEDGKYVSLDESPRSAVFEAVEQHYSSTITMIVRSSRPTADIVTDLRTTLGRLDPGLPLYETQSLDEMLGLVLLPSRLASIALGGFGVLALLLAMTGLHGVVTNAVAKRRREIGIRVAIGAQPAQVVRLVMLRTLVLLGLGAMVGAAVVFATGRVLSSVVYDASPRDPIVLAGVGLSLVVVGAVSCWGPVRRALSVNPTDALRAQ